VVSADFSQVSDPSGTLSPLDLTTLGQPKFTLTVDGRTQDITLDLGFKVNPDGSITRLNYPTRLSANPFAQLYFSQDGYEEGVFDRIEVITEEGLIKAWYTNNKDLPVAKLFLADFNGYEESLEKVGNNLFRAKANATPFIFAPGAGERARILSGALETSNTDLAQEMVHLILLQRAFQSNSRVITTADQMLEDFLRQR
jgi:flagellar hook protein FlgE